MLQGELSLVCASPAADTRRNFSSLLLPNLSEAKAGPQVDCQEPRAQLHGSWFLSEAVEEQHHTQTGFGCGKQRDEHEALGSEGRKELKQEKAKKNDSSGEGNTKPTGISFQHGDCYFSC